MSVLAQASREVLGGLKAWPVWWMLGTNDVMRRYKRSRIGQFWITISMAAMILAMGFLFSSLFRTDVQAYLPFLAVSLVLWAFISTSINEGCNAFTDSSGLIMHASFPTFTYVLRVLLRNGVVLLHNGLIILAVMIYFVIAPGPETLLIVPGFLLLVLNLIWIMYALAIIAARYRDVPMIVQNIVQVGFFLSPVIFKPSQLSPDHPLVLLNPFAYLLAVVRDPLLGVAPSSVTYAVVIAFAVAGWAATLSLAGRYARRVVYWL
jgi:lipopolysaccharide transport system permease protein